MLLPPANEVSEGYVFTGACLSTQGGVCPIACWDTPPGPEADTPPEQTPPRDQRQTPPWDQTAPPPPAVHAVRYGQQSGGTHPTGMHTCFKNFQQLQL